MKKALVALAAVTLAALATAPAEARVRTGVLTCQVAPGVGLVIGSQKAVDCRYKSARGYREHYVGRITRVGLDVGFTSGGKIVWAVYTATRGGRGALAGTYAGASAEATVAAGVGANALVGGSNRSVTLQPLSVGAQQGLNLAVAVSGLELEYARR